MNGGDGLENGKDSEEMGMKGEKVRVDLRKVEEWKACVVKKLRGGVEGVVKGNKVEMVKGEGYLVERNCVGVMDEN